jgi:hypothetical protein
LTILIYFDKMGRKKRSIIGGQTRNSSLISNREFCESSLFLTTNYASWVTILGLHTSRGNQSYFSMLQ